MDKIEMLVFDVDGTLVIPKNDMVPISTQIAIKKAKTKGIKITIATGRNHYALGNALNALRPDYVVGCCGCCVYDHAKQTMIYTHTMESTDVTTLIETANHHDLALMFKFEDAMYFYNKPEGIGWLTDDYKKTVNAKYMIFNDTTRHMRGSLPFTAMMYGDEKCIESLSQHTHLQIIPAGGGGYDIVPNGINKATGLTALASYLNMAPTHMMAFGDHYNDMEMFDLIPNTVAMGNGVDALKQKASYVTSNVEDDGIANALLHYGIIDDVQQ